MEVTETNQRRYVRNRDTIFHEYPLCCFIAVVVPNAVFVLNEGPRLASAHEEHCFAVFGPRDAQRQAIQQDSFLRAAEIRAVVHKLVRFAA